MDIYLDFEATQFKENVLAIGATCKYGDFDCVVRPPKGDKVTKFITSLTGITAEMGKTALTADEAFSDFYNWITEVGQIDGSPMFYHVYGNMDKVFLKNTARYIESDFIREFVENLSESLIDDSNKVCRYFHTKAIGVYKAWRFFDPETREQDHDPLNDSIALAKIIDYISKAEPLENCPFEENKPQLPKEKKERTSLLEGCKIKCINVQNDKEKVFLNEGEAFSWLFKKVKRNHPKTLKKNVKKRLKKAILNNTIYCNYIWNKEEDI